MPSIDNDKAHPMPASEPNGSDSFTHGKVTIEVGGEVFITTRDTLMTGSTYFNSLLSGRWEHNLQGDGSFFLDGDPKLFAHILQFLRRGTAPLFWDPTKGHDYNQYNALLGEARYLGVEKLVEWIEKKGYHDAVTVRYGSVCADDGLKWHKPSNFHLETQTATSPYYKWECKGNHVSPLSCPAWCSEDYVKPVWLQYTKFIYGGVEREVTFNEDACKP